MQQVKVTMDEHDARELEHVAMEKMMRCVRNQEKDPSPPSRPPRRIASPSPTTVPPFGSMMSSQSYGPDDDLEGEPKGGLDEGEEGSQHEAEDQMDEQR